MSLTTDRNYLIPAGSNLPYQQLLAAYAVLTANATLIAQQPDLTLSLLPTLPEDQALVRQHVDFFRNEPTLLGGILDCFQSVKTISSQVQNMARQLLPTAQRLDQGPDEHKKRYETDLKTFRTALTALSTTTTSLNPDSHSASLGLKRVLEGLTGFYNGQLADDVTRFETAKKQAVFAGTIERLSLQINTLQTQIDGLNNDIALGATTQIVPALKFGFSIGKEISSALTDPGKLLLNVGFAIKDEIDQANAFAEEMRRKNSELNSLIGQYRNLVQGYESSKQELSILLTVTGHSKTFRDNLKSAITAITLILGQVQLLHDGITDLISIDSSEVENFFTDQLNAAVEGCRNLSETCDQNLQFARTLNPS